MNKRTDWTTCLTQLSRNREVRGLLAELKGFGFEGRISGGSHIQLRHPRMTGLITVASTPSEYRSTKNSRAQIKRAMRAAHIIA
jgi:predicted RNA binding protein YcfA (HicA-like mRNA interferase family)